MTTSNLQPWNSAQYLKSAEDIQLYLEACIEEAGDDQRFMAKVYENIQRARCFLKQSKPSEHF